jgi:hypothetical protein
LARASDLSAEVDAIVELESELVSIGYCRCRRGGFRFAKCCARKECEIQIKAYHRLPKSAPPSGVRPQPPKASLVVANLALDRIHYRYL